MIHHLILFWLSYALLLGAFISQIKFKLVWVLTSLVLVGSMGNFFVMQFNSGQMPVFFGAARISLETKQQMEYVPKHVQATTATKLPLLADRINIEKFRVICSVGDLAMLVAFNSFMMFIFW